MTRTRVLGLLLALGLVLGLAAAPPSAVAGGPWTPTGSLSVPRGGHSAVLLLDGRVLVAGGKGSSQSLTSAELYDPATGEWQVTGDLNTGRAHHTATLLLDGRALLAGGDTYSQVAVTSGAELYDPATGQWSLTGSMAAPRVGHTATRLLDGRVLVAGGYAGDSAIESSAELYDPATGQWTLTGSMAAARSEHAAARLPDGRVLVVGGYNVGGVLAGAELYDPATGQWSPAGSLSRARDHHTATLLADGRVLVAGGSECARTDCPIAGGELYYPATGLWVTTGSLVTARDWHGAALLPSGLVVVAGGVGTGGSALASAEVYDPASGKWAETAAMLDARWLFSFTSLADGRVLAAAGFDSAGYLASAEIYQAIAPIIMHVGAIEGGIALDPYGHTLLRVRVRVDDEWGSVLGYAAVAASIWSPLGGPYPRTRLTRPATGSARFFWGAKASGKWQLCVENITRAGYLYAPGDDVVTCVEWKN